MKTFIMLLLLGTSAHAAPLYLSCKGEAHMEGRTVGEPEQTTISITIDGPNVKVEDLALVLIYSNDDDVWTFGSGGVGVYYGQINRITGLAQITISITKSINSFFDGVCHKREKAFLTALRRGVYMASGSRAVLNWQQAGKSHYRCSSGRPSGSNLTLGTLA